MQRRSRGRSTGSIIGALTLLASSCAPNPTPPTDGGQQDSAKPDSADQDTQPKKPSATDKGSPSLPSEESEPGETTPSTGETSSPEQESSAKFDLGAMPSAEDTTEGIRPCEIDFLFVVDSSASMGIKQENLARSVPRFIKSMMTSTDMKKDYHIGVVTTDESPGNIKKCAFTGGLVVQTQNFDEVRLCGPYKSGYSYMTHDDDLHQSFDCAARPGISGNTEEKPIDAIRGALNPKHAGQGACNESFLRKDGLLVVVLITDEDDRHDLGGSLGEPDAWHQELLAAKGGNEKQIVVVSITVPPKPNACKPGDLIAKETKRLNAFTKKFGARGFIADVCEDDYGLIFEQALGIIDFACDELHPPPE